MKSDAPEIRSYRDLQVWQFGMDLAVECYRVSAGFPRGELYGLTAQLRRAAVSVPANLAERHGRDSTRDYLRFVRIANGSLKEVETHLMIACRVGILECVVEEELLQHCDRLGRMLAALARSLKRHADSEA